MSAMIGVDWGTSSFRAYLLDGDGTILKKVQSDTGILNVENKNFSAVLQEQINNFGDSVLDLPIIASGMITSKNGWFETPYVECPASQADLAKGLCFLENETFGKLWFAPGVKQYSPEADIMRGEETQLAGVLPDSEMVVILPGTHSKWVEMRSGVITHFKTFMTGELYAAVLQGTILKTVRNQEWIQKRFLEGVYSGYNRFRAGGTILSGLFQMRVQTILGLAPEQGGKSFLSGLLIGAEIGEAVKSGFACKNSVQIVGEDSIAEIYLAALKECSISSEIHSSECAAQGLYNIAKIRKLL